MESLDILQRLVDRWHADCVAGFAPNDREIDRNLISRTECCADELEKVIYALKILNKSVGLQ